MKFLSGELASSAEISGDRLIFSRKVSSKEVNRKIEKYVNRFVLCPSCRKPDTELNNEGNKAFLKCLACGKKAEVHKI
jgi:translation initiation factor 2 subunit 2